MDLVYRRITGRPGLADPRMQLRRWPLDLVEWPSHNSDRMDITLERDWLLYPNAEFVVTTALPADEAFGWTDFLTEGATCGVDGGSGMVYQAPNPWLLLYWMQEYYSVDY